MDRKTRVGVLLVAVVVGFVGAWWWSGRDAPPGAAPVAEVAAPPAERPRARIPRAPASKGVAPPTSPGSPGSPASAGSPASPGSAGSAAPDAAGEAPASEGPIDRREDPPPGAEATRAAILERMDAVRDDIGACLAEWRELDPGLAGEVAVGFQVDATGLTDAWVADHSDVPMGPLSCFSSAVYGVDWTGVTAEPLEVTFPFTFTPDGGDGEGGAG